MENLLIMVLWNGVQSLNNKKFYVQEYDEEKGDFVGKWVPRPAFLDRSLKKTNTDNEHTEH